MATRVSAKVHEASIIFALIDRCERAQFEKFRECVVGSVWNRDLKGNLAPIDLAMSIVHKLEKEGFEVVYDDAAKIEIEAKKNIARSELQDAEARLAKLQKRLAKEGKSLYPFQVEGVKRLSWRDRYLLADEMGLGKTVQAIMAIPDGSPVVIVCPAIAKGVWEREFAKWRPDFKVKTVSGRGKFSWPNPGVVHIVNYDILPAPPKAAAPTAEKVKVVKRSGIVKSKLPQAGTVLIADEAHALKSWKSKRTQSFRRMSEEARDAGGKVWVLTGTPLLNKPPELWGVLSAAGLEREAFGSWANFGYLFGAWKNAWGGTEWGSVKEPENVGNALRKVMLRRIRRDVMSDLPEKTYDEIEVELDAEAIRACEEVMQVMEENGYDIEALLRGEFQFETISRMRATLAAAKIEALLEVVASHEEQEEPLVVFSAHRAPIDAIVGRDGWAIITGDTPPAERKAIEDDFRAGRYIGVAGTIQAMGTAVRFERAAKVLFVDLAWTPALNQQAEARVEAVTQKRGVIVTTLVGDHKLDRAVASTLQKKQRTIDASVNMGITE